MKTFTLAVVLGMFGVCSLADAASISLHVELGNHEYFLPPQVAWSFSSWDHSLINSSDNLIPLTVIHLNTFNSDANLTKQRRINTRRLMMSGLRTIWIVSQTRLTSWLTYPNNV